MLRPFGKTGLQVSALGFGSGHLGAAAIDEDDVSRLLNEVLDAGINLIDTARSYGLAEERIGRHLQHRRAEFVLSTKIGYGIDGIPDWTGPCITAGIDAALLRLRTDWIDIAHLHSCPLEILQTEEILFALEEAVRAGKVRVAAYSGDNEPLEWAVSSGRFFGVQTSLNLFDQQVIERGLPAAATHGLGVIAKRPLGNVPWRFAEQPFGDYCEPYWLRMRAMGIDPRGLDWSELALRFAAFVPGVASCIVGTRRLDHLRQDILSVSRGPLPDELFASLRAAFIAHGADWRGQI